MKIHELMTRDVSLGRPDQTIRELATAMANSDFGAVPISDKDRLVGMVTDRDMVVRGLAKGLGPDAQVSLVMSPEVKYCYDDQEVDEVAQNMASQQIRRLPVVDRDKRLVGIVALADIATQGEVDAAARAIEGISETVR
jgi:CBS domain-containing protein